MGRTAPGYAVVVVDGFFKNTFFILLRIALWTILDKNLLFNNIF